MAAPLKRDGVASPGAPLDIAVIGLAGIYPGAADAAAFWQNICAARDCTSEADPDWTGPYFEAQTQADDRIYTTRGGFLRELAHVDPLEVGLMPAVAAGSDPDHLIALKVARQAMRDAGYLDGARKFDGARAGVVIARGTYGNRGMAGMLARGFFMDQMMDVVRQLRPDFSEADIRALQTDLKKQLPPYGGDVVGVLTPNVIASLIANRLDFMGPAYIVDAACASSLIAVDSAVQELASGRCDLMLAGGTQVQTPPQLFIQFCQINALSRDRLRPFQKGSEGTLLGEGCGMLVLKRRADAERDGDRIYALIRGVGVSSDGRAKGLLAPRLEGEVLAMQRAYESSGIDPRTVDLIEAHGTGTSVGDATEIESLSAVFGARGAGAQIAISAVKSMIGHCLPATGAASMIKTVLALHHKLLPPMLCEEPDPALHLERTPFYLNTQTRPWIHGADTPRRAGVNAFGFGGINAHVILEEYVPRARKPAPVPRLNPPAGSELLLCSADSAEELRARIETLLAALRAPQVPSLAQLARASAMVASPRHAHRLALVAESREDAIKKLEQALEKLAKSGGKPFRARGGAQYGQGAAPGRLCVLFPGEGSQYPGMLAELCLHFPQVRDWFDFIEEGAHARGSRSRAQALFPAPTMLDAAQRRELEQALFEMDLGAESVFAASLGLHALFESLGLKPDAMLGHSTGENTALTACRVRRYEHRHEVADAVQAVHALYRKLESEGRIAQGCLLTVGALSTQTRAMLLDELSATGMQLAMDNCPNQVVLFGSAEAAERLRVRLADEGAVCQALPFGRAYHTPLFKPLADAFRTYFRTLDFGPGTVPLYSARSAAPFPDEPDAIRELTAQQWENPVRFTATLERLYADGFRVFLELGPSANLTAFVGDTLRSQPDVLALSANSRRGSALTHLQQTLAQLFAAGIAFDAARLYDHRDIAAFDLDQPLSAPRATRTPLKLEMPVVRLPDKWKRPLPTSAGSTASMGGQSSPLAQLAPLTPPQPPASDDPRALALQAHFVLMQQFLDGQARVLDLFSGRGPAAPVPNALPALADAPADADFPLLGAVQPGPPERLVCERRYTLDTDLFLRDHCIGGQPSALDASLTAIPVMPFTFSMEICAQAARRLFGSGVVIAIEQARGSRWLSLDEGTLHLRTQAERLPGQPQLVHCRLFRLDQGGPPGGMAVFEASVRIADHYPAVPAPLDWTSPDSQAPQFNADGALYARGMFHGPRLQGARQVLRWGAGGIDMRLTTLPTQDYFRFTASPGLQTDAALVDVLGQTLYYALQEQHGGTRNCFPFQIASARFFAPPLAAGSAVSSRANLRVPEEGRLCADIDALDAQGRVLMRMEGWEDRTFEVPQHFYEFRLDPPRAFLSARWMDGLLPPGLVARRVAPLPEGFLDSGGGIWARGLAHMVLDAQERALWYALPASGTRRHEWLLGRVAAKEAARDWFAQRHGFALASADIRILSDARGRPLVHCAQVASLPMPAVSISHSQGWAAAVVADAGLAVGLDYQRLERVHGEDLLRGGFAESEQGFITSAPVATRTHVAAALWCAKEAAAKAAGLGFQGQPLRWTVSACSLEPQTVSFGSARIHHAGQDYDVAIQFDESSAVSALCVAVNGLPLATA